MRSIKILACLTASLLATAVAGTASAQAQTAESQGEPQVSDEAPLGINDIVVTARKRSESLQDVPASILAIGSDQIEGLNAKSLQDLNGATPNFRVADDGSLSIRGITSNARNAGFEAGAATYLDGVYQGRPFGNTQDLTDIDRVEILRGPQGTLYGKNTTAGAVSIVTVRPGNSWTGRGEIQYSSFNELRMSGFVAGPIAPDLVGIKVSAFRGKSRGYQFNKSTDEYFGRVDTIGGRAELRLTTGPFDISARGDIIRDNSTPSHPEPVVGLLSNTSPGRDTTDFNHGYVARRGGGGGSLTVDTDLGGGYSLTSISAWRMLNVKVGLDDDFGPLDLVYHDWNDDSSQFTQEVRLTSPTTGMFSWILGGYYFQQKLTSDRPVVLTSNFPVAGTVDDDVTTRTHAFAAFANADFRFSDALTLNLGLRYTNERKRLNFVQVGLPALGYPSLTINDRFTDNDLSPTAALSYKFSPDVTAYVKFSRGYKSGGWNPDLTTSTQIGFDSENVNNYEAGIRTRLAGGRLGINITGYYMDYDNLQVSQFLGTFSGYVVTNAGQARVKGVEVEVQARPSSWLTFSAAGAYNSAKYVDFATGLGNNYAGQQFTNVPEFSGYLAADIAAPVTDGIKFIAHGDVRYQGKIFFDDARTVNPVVGGFSQNGYALVNLRAGFSLDNGFELSGFVENLTNNRALTNRGPDALGLGIVLDNYVPPRQFGVRANFRF